MEMFRMVFGAKKNKKLNINLVYILRKIMDSVG